MSRLGRKRTAQEEPDIDMVPIMNMFLVLIPFLLMSASFIHLKAIKASVPVQAQRVVEQTEEKEKKVSVTMVVEIKGEEMALSAISDMLGAGELEELKARIGKAADDADPLEEMVGHLSRVKDKYPASDTMILIPDESTLYDTIIQTMDAARRTEDKALFTNVVLSSKVG